MIFWGMDMRFKLPRKPERLVREVLAPEQIRRLIAACADVKSRAVVALLAYTGMRTAELRELKAGDLDFKNLTVRIVMGKNFRDRAARCRNCPSVETRRQPLF